MTLDQTALKNAFSRLFRGLDGYPAKVSDAGPVWAKLYASYAKAAVARTTVPLAASIEASTTALGIALGTVFEAGFAAGANALGSLPATMAGAFAAFWPPVTFAAPGAPPPVVGVAVSPPGNLARDLTNFFSSGAGSTGSLPNADRQAGQLASILDTWTRTVTVTNTPVSGTPETVQLT